MAAAVIDRGLVVFDYGGFGPGETRCAVGVESRRSVVAAAVGLAPAGFVLAADRSADVAVVARFLSDPAAAGFVWFQVVEVAWKRFSAV